MSLAQANTSSLKYVVETTAGTTPAAAMTKVNYTTSSLNATINTTVSATIESSRNVVDLVRTNGSSGGEIGFELRFAEYRPFVESALGSAFSTAVSVSATTISASATDNSLNDSGAGFSTANILPGHWIRVSGFTTNGTTFIAKVVSVTTSKIVVSHKTLVNEVAGAVITVKGSSIRNGAVKKTFTLEEEFTDLTTTFVNYKGMQVNTMTLNAASGSIVNGNFGFMGLTTTYTTATAGTGAEVAASTNGIMSATANVGTIFIDGTAVSGTYFKNVNLSTTNNGRSLDAISNLYPVAVNLGSFNATFAVTAFFDSTTLLAKFINGTSFALAYSFYDAAGNYIVVDAPYCKFNAGTLSGKALNSDIMQDLSITALKDPTHGYMLQISELG